jgi:hypothetical protein
MFKFWRSTCDVQMRSGFGLPHRGVGIASLILLGEYLCFFTLADWCRKPAMLAKLQWSYGLLIWGDTEYEIEPFTFKWSWNPLTQSRFVGERVMRAAFDEKMRDYFDKSLHSERSS